MKKLLCIFMSITVFISASFSFCMVSYASQTTDIAKTQLGTSDTYYEFDAQSKTLTISGTGATPDFINSESSIPWFGWRWDGSIEKVVVEEGITVLGNSALRQVTASEISLPSTLTKISDYALSATTGVESWTLPFGLTQISSNAFDRCITMKNITLPKTLEKISARAFQNCTSLCEIVIPYNVSLIGSNAFYGCTSLTKVTFQSLTATVSIGMNAFTGCSSLKNISVPMNATCSSKCLGYSDSGVKYTDFTMNVFDSSKGYIYAESKFSYDMIDSIDMNCGIEYRNTYNEDNVNNKYHFIFTADSTAEYNFYSKGNCDVEAELKDSSGKLIAENDDIDKNTDRNFCVSAQLTKGETYHLYVNSYMSKSYGDYSIIVYPDEILSFDIKGSLNFSASDSEQREGCRYFNITNDLLSDFVLNVNFATGFCDKIYYQPGYFDNKTISLYDNQDNVHFICGNNTSVIMIDDISSNYDVFIEHSYNEEVFAPTVDNDGYTLYKCMLCSDSYKGNYVPTTAVTVSGKAVLKENKNGSHENNIPYKNATFYANGRVYSIDENGFWSFNTFDDCDITFNNEFGKDVTIHIDVSGENLDYGCVVFEGYDFNKDGNVNAKDFYLFRKHFKNGELSEDYWKFAHNFFIK